MKTTNLISTPGITGNIGSCVTSSIDVTTGRTLFQQDIETITTNSCNGQVDHYYSWEFTGMTVLVAFGFLFCFVVGAIAWSVKD